MRRVFNEKNPHDNFTTPWHVLLGVCTRAYHACPAPTNKRLSVESHLFDHQKNSKSTVFGQSQTKNHAQRRQTWEKSKKDRRKRNRRERQSAITETEEKDRETWLYRTGMREAKMIERGERRKSQRVKGTKERGTTQEGCWKRITTTGR